MAAVYNTDKFNSKSTLLAHGCSDADAIKLAAVKVDWNVDFGGPRIAWHRKVAGVCITPKLEITSNQIIACDESSTKDADMSRLIEF